MDWTESLKPIHFDACTSTPVEFLFEVLCKKGVLFPVEVSYSSVNNVLKPRNNILKVWKWDAKQLSFIVFFKSNQTF